jgi:hypothetical protein
LQAGEYVEEELEMHIGTKVGEFSLSKRHMLLSGLEVETTYEGDIIQEHKITQQVKSEIDSNFQKFAEKYGMNAGASAGTKKRGKEPKSVASGLLSQFQEKLNSTIGN